MMIKTKHTSKFSRHIDKVIISYIEKNNFPLKYVINV